MSLQFRPAAPALMLLASGCLPAAPAMPAAPAPAPAPVPAAVSAQAHGPAMRLLGERQSGATVELAAGQGARVELMGVPSAGYIWRVRTADPAITVASTTRRPADPAGRSRGMVGGPDWTIFDLDLAGAGPARITLDYGRPWELEAGAAPVRTVIYVLVRH